MQAFGSRPFNERPLCATSSHSITVHSANEPSPSDQVPPMQRAAINQLSSDIALPNRSRIVQCRRTSQNIAALVPRGGLHQPQDINDLGKGGSTDRSTRSLRFPGKVSHQRADFPACAQIRRGPLAGQWSRRAAPGVLAIFKIMLSSSGVVASDPPRPYKPAARFGTISRTLRIVAFRISLHSVRDPRDVRATPCYLCSTSHRSRS